MTEDQKKEALDLYRHGVRVNSIHKLIGATDGQVKRYLYKILKVPCRNIKHSTKVLSEIKKLRSQGKRGKQIEQEVGMTNAQIRYLFHMTGTGYRKMDRNRGK